MEWKRMKKALAEVRLRELYGDDCQPIAGSEKNTPEEMQELRDELKRAYDYASGSTAGNYERDLRFAMDIYRMMSDSGAYAMTLTEAADAAIWRHLSIEVVPEIVMDRWYGKGQKLPVDHFYEKPNRIYLKSLWWYVYLSWQGDAQSTFKILQGNSTDTIVGLVERSGRKGYQPEVYREIMRQFATPPDGLTAHDGNLFRGVMKLHTARFVNLEPSLCDGGVEGYVKGLFEYFSKEELT